MSGSDPNERFPCFVKFGEKIEPLSHALETKEKYHIMARNALRYLTYGKKLSESFLLNWESFKALCLQRNDALLRALCEEMQELFFNIFKEVQERIPAFNERIEIFIKNILAALPYMNPQMETFFLPIKKGMAWSLIPFKLEKIDISPQQGLLANVIEDQDRLYAYGLTPMDDDVSPYLLLMGSHYPSGQGAAINWLYNFLPTYSVGEGHDLTHVAKWLQKHPQAILTGHSKGGTMAMLIGSYFPTQIQEVNCLNPVFLSKATLRRLSKIRQLYRQQLPIINIYLQQRDLVFLFGKEIVEGARLFQISNKQEPCSLFAAHVHYIAGRAESCIHVLSMNELTTLKMRYEWMLNVKAILNWLLFPTLYCRLLMIIGLRKAHAYCRPQHLLFRKIFVVCEFLISVLVRCLFFLVLALLTLIGILSGIIYSIITTPFKFIAGKLVK